MSSVAMHISNGIVNGPVSAAFGAVAIAGVAVAVARGRADLNDRLAPMAGLVAAFIFAVQMLNFPVLPGVSGHLLGGALAALLVGPWVGALCVSVVLVVQSLLFADGGLTALGLNITNMALIGTAAGYLLIMALRTVLPRTPTGLAITAFIASVVSVTAASQGFVLQFFLGGTTAGLSIGGISATMAGVHALIGIGEGLIAAVTVATVAKVRPDLVYAWRRKRRSAHVHTPVAVAAPALAEGTTTLVPTRAAGAMSKRLVWFVGGGLLVALLLAGVVSNFASGSPDGLDAATREGCTFDEQGAVVDGTCIAEQAQDHQFGDSPLADYGIKGIGNFYLSTGLAGVLGVLLTFGIGGGLFWLVRRRGSTPEDAESAVEPGRKLTGAGDTHSAQPAERTVGHRLHLDRDSPVHRMAAEVKIAATVLFTCVVVLTPREELLPFAGYTLLLAVVAAFARVRPGWLLKRSLIEAPFVILAVVLPFVGTGETVRWLGLDLHVEGLYGAWNIVAKGTLGVWASLLLAATTTPRDLILGLDRLRCPQILTQIATFMLRYLEVITEEARRMRVARVARGYDPRFLWQVKAYAVGIGALFLRAFERGERVYLAMVSRGYTGRMPAAGGAGAGLLQWTAGALLPLAAAAIVVGAVLR